MKIKATVSTQQDLRLRSSITLRDISKMDDVDVLNLTDGSVLVYSADSSKWESTTILEKQIVECGQY